MSGLDGIGRPFRIAVAGEVLTELGERLARARFPEQQAGPDWATGTPLDYARRLRDFWRDRFDWRAWEARLNQLDQRLIDVDGQLIHVVIVEGSGDRPLPLMMTNGWPGSFLEFLDVAERLAHPERFGGRADEAFTVIIPSLPGYGFSPPPAEPQSPLVIAGLWARLVEVLGFERCIAYGSDWGSLVTATLALRHPERLAAFMLTSPGQMPALGPDAPPPTEEETAWLTAVQRRMQPESGYQIVQGTKPQSLAYGHTDSPIALACWIAEKFHGWTTPGSTSDPSLPMDELIANVMLYWLNGSIAPMWLYRFMNEVVPLSGCGRVAPPAGFLFSTKDLLVPPPRSWLERTYDVGRYMVADSIGHFPGHEDPDLLVAELRGFFAPYRMTA